VEVTKDSFIMLQEIIVFIIVGCAAFYLARLVFGTFTSKRGCGGCDNAKKDAPQQLMQIQVKKKP
jgi:hypothetical protein